MYHKDDNDWLDILGGKWVPDANCEVAEEAMALRGALQARLRRQSLPLLRLKVYQKREKSWSRTLVESFSKLSNWLSDWFYEMGRLPNWPYATVAASLFVLVVIPGIIPPQQGIEKSFPAYLELTVSDPQSTTQQIQKVLQETGIINHQAQLEDRWKLSVELQASDYPKMSDVLAAYGLELPPAGQFNKLVLVIKGGESLTMP